MSIEKAVDQEAPNLVANPNNIYLNILNNIQNCNSDQLLCEVVSALPAACNNQACATAAINKMVDPSSMLAEFIISKFAVHIQSSREKLLTLFHKLSEGDLWFVLARLDPAKDYAKEIMLSVLHALADRVDDGLEGYANDIFPFFASLPAHMLNDPDMLIAMLYISHHHIYSLIMDLLHEKTLADVDVLLKIVATVDAEHLSIAAPYFIIDSAEDSQRLHQAIMAKAGPERADTLLDATKINLDTVSAAIQSAGFFAESGEQLSDKAYPTPHFAYMRVGCCLPQP